MTNPIIILLDIETAPLISYNWTAYESNALKILEPSKIISCAWKILGEEKTYCKCLSDYEGYTSGQVDDEKLIKTLWGVVDKAQILITQNGDAFDIKKLNSRFIYYHLPAPSPFQSVDTLKAARKWFKFDKNNLSELGEYLGEGKKAETGGLNLWFKCLDGDKKSWEILKKYNIQDVVLLEKVYLRLRPYITNHPNLGAIAERKDMVCSACMSTNLIKRGFSYTASGTRKQRYQCGDCLSWTTGKYERNSFVVEEDDDGNE